MYDEVIKQIEKEKVMNAKDFFSAIKSVLHSFPSLDKEEIIQLFVEAKLTHEIAWEIVKKEDYVRKFYVLMNENAADMQKLYTLAMTKQKFPEEYENVIQHLLYLYQKHDQQNIKNHQSIALNVIYNLLLMPEFRNCFQHDNKIVPLFMKGFNDDIAKFIKSECKDKMLQDELLKSCAPRELDSVFVDAQLKKLFGFKDPLSPEQEDIISIHKFLADVSEGSAILRQLAVLEAELKKEAGDKYDSVTKMLKGYKEGAVFEDKQIQRLLSHFFRKWAETNGFLGYAKFKRFLNEDEFLSKLGMGLIFKDTTFQSSEHGDFSHAIQWFLICMWNKENPSSRKLHCDPVALLQWIGKNQKGPEWFKTFEISAKSIYKPSAMDFRNTQHIHAYLKSANCPFPILHQLSIARDAKGTPPPSEIKIEEFKPK